MTELAHAPSGMVVPEWTIGDSMRKAREHAAISQAELARDIGISRTTIVAYETGRSKPSRPALLAWSMRTGVSYEWMCHGDTQPCGPPRKSEISGASPQADAIVYKMHYKLDVNRTG